MVKVMKEFMYELHLHQDLDLIIFIRHHHLTFKWLTKRIFTPSAKANLACSKFHLSAF